MKKNLAFLLAGVAICSALGSAGPPEIRLRKTAVVQRVLPKRLAFSPDGRFVALSGTIQKVDVGQGPGLSLQMTNIEQVMLLVDARNFKEIRRFMKGPAKDIFGSDPVTFSPDGHRVIGVVDSSIRVWDAERGKQLASWGRELSTVVFSNDRRLALAKGNDGAYVLFDLADGRSLASYPRASEDAEMLAIDAERPCLVYMKDRNVVLKNLKTADETVLGEWAVKSVKWAAVAPDGNTLALADDAGAVVLWDIAGKKKLGERPGGTKAARSLAFPPDGSMLAYVAEGKLNVWTVTDLSITSVETKHSLGISNIAFSGDSRTLATLGVLVDPEIKLWDVVLSATASPKAPE